MVKVDRVRFFWGRAWGQGTLPANGTSNLEPAGRVWVLYPSLPVARLRPLEEHIGAALARRRFVMCLVSCFAGLSLVLAVTGSYDVMPHAESKPPFGERRLDVARKPAPGQRLGPREVDEKPRLGDDLRGGLRGILRGDLRGVPMADSGTIRTSTLSRSQ